MSLRRNETIFGAGWSDGTTVDYGNLVGMTPGILPWGIDPVNGPEPQNRPAETRYIIFMILIHNSINYFVKGCPGAPQ
jgi:hypothetical protein